MQTRRMAMTTLAGAALAIGAAPVALAADDDTDLPKVKEITGQPPAMDFGDGVKVPLSKNAFLTLWEGPTYWLTFGFGTAPFADRAQGLAVHHAIGAMRFLLLTLAFAPERLIKVEGNGWRQEVENPSNYVFGELELPGHPARAMTDAFLGLNANAASEFFLFGEGSGMSSIGPSDPRIVTPNIGAASAGINRAGVQRALNAFCSYSVRKKELSLEDVRNRAKEVHL